MGKRITVAPPRVIGSVAVFDTDRSITGQDGSGYTLRDSGDDTFPARLASRLFAAVPGVDHVFIASSQLSLRRDHPWDDAALAAAASVIAEFFVHYTERVSG